MEFFNPNSNVNFMGIRRYTVAVSVILMIASIVSLATRGLNFGLDFTGGSLVEVTFTQPTEQHDVSAALEKAGFKGAVVQRFDTKNYSIRLGPNEGAEAGKTKVTESSIDARSAAITHHVEQALTSSGHPATVKPSVYVGPQVGKDLATNGIVAVVVVLAGIMIYIAIRFEWRFAVATMLTEIHDVLLTVGFFSLTGHEFDLTVLAAVLAVDGYSVNDTIVVFDRVRELFRSTRKGEPLDILNRAVNNTLSRTIMTSLATMVTVVALFFFGGSSLHGFSIALMVGIVVGTLSSIFFACPILNIFGVSKQDLMPKLRDEAELARRP
ncbi:MAG: protein translocase subunit SecF [Proteobacteria bacterium]|nr:protein translocase subunit SecF [Pseudomonadota bacterium]MBS0460948.1 protein translocase subunit SecF [Pseudomonadota bacterium]